MIECDMLQGNINRMMVTDDHEDDHKWTIISDELALCDEIIGKSAFREDWKEDDANEYEQSDIKKWLEKWAHENGLLEATHGE